VTCALPSLPCEAGAITKHCPDCDQHLPPSSFSLNRHGNPRPQCRPCRSARESARYAMKKQAEAEGKPHWMIEREMKRAAEPAWKRAHRDRINRDREARKLAADHERDRQQTDGDPKVCKGCEATLPISDFVSKTSGKPHSYCRPCQATKARERYYRKLGREVPATAARTLTPEQLREIDTRSAHLLSLLDGTASGERLETQQEWEAVAMELSKLWLRSGEKECISCLEKVSSEKMHPPGPGNSYPNHCHSCAEAAHEQNSIATYGAPPGHRLIPLNDGTEIIIAELARRHREREATYRLSRYQR
jgi:hypothetical protein